MLCSYKFRPFELEAHRRGSSNHKYSVVPIVRIMALWALLPLVPVFAGDLSRYRQFQFGMDLSTVARLAHSDLSQVKVLHRRPALIQELEWNPELVPALASQPDPVKAVIFSFSDGALFRILITYDDYKTEGLTVDDITAALVGIYGTASHPAARIAVHSPLDEDTATVLAQWEDPEYSLRLVRLSYQSRFGLLFVRKTLDDMARIATAQAKRMEEQEAPQREADRRKQQEETERSEHAKARLANRPNFRP